MRYDARDGNDPDAKMTPMIDVVFLLLIFFLLTFQIIAPEGDLTIHAPQAAAEPVDPLPPAPLLIRITLQADGQGELAAIHMGGRKMADFDRLRREVRRFVHDDPGHASAAAGAEVELQCDPNLRFEHAMRALTSVSGYVDRHRIVPLVEKIRFTPQSEIRNLKSEILSHARG